MIGGANTGGRGYRIDTTVGGGLHALEAATGSKVWSAVPQPCANRPTGGPAQPAAVTAIPGVVFSGSIDGHLRGYAVADGTVIWEVDTAQPFGTVNGPTATGGSDQRSRTHCRERYAVRGVRLREAWRTVGVLGRWTIAPPDVGRSMLEIELTKENRP